MSPSRIIKAGAFALACANTVSATLQYTLESTDDYSGTNFFDMFNFFTGPDPTSGYVQYQSQSSASSSTFGGPLVKYTDGQAYMGVDSWNTYDPNGAGRPSVRIETKKQYTHGLIIANITHMPASVCGTWPAFWTVSEDNYPRWGEIDILENIHEETVSLETLHTAPSCTVAGSQMTGKETSYNCDDVASSGSGCSATNSDPNSYGTPFNQNGGGVYAVEWTSAGIAIWNWGPKNIPQNIKDGTPDSSKWGLPAFNTVGGSCDIDSHFQNHNIVFDTTFCGNWAGQDYFWQKTSCYDPNKYPTCKSYVAANPAKYSDAYWLIDSLKVYQKTLVADKPTSSSSIVSSTSSTTSSSSSSTSSSSTISTTSSTSSSVSTTSSSTSSTSSSNSLVSSTSSTSSSASVSSSSSSSVTSSSSSVSVSSTSSSSTLSISSSSGSSSSTAVPTTSSTLSVSSSSSSSISVAVPTTSSTLSVSTSSSSSVSVSIPATSSSSAVSSSSFVSSSAPGGQFPETSSSIGSTSSSSVSVSSSALSTSSAQTTTSGTAEVTSSTSSSLTLSFSSSATSTKGPLSTSTSETGSATVSSGSSTYVSSSSSSASFRTTPAPLTTSDVPYTTSTVYTENTYTITSCAPTVTNCPVGSVTTETIALYTTVCPVSQASTPSATSTPTLTTSTVYTTSVYTITSCAATVTDCPARIGKVTTEVISLYTTVCPVSEATSKPYTPPTPTPISTTSTVYLTSIYTITSCAPTVTNCPAKIGQVTTEIITSTIVGAVTPTIISSVPAFTGVPSSIKYSSPTPGPSAPSSAPAQSGAASAPGAPSVPSSAGASAGVPNSPVSIIVSTAIVVPINTPATPSGPVTVLLSTATVVPVYTPAYTYSTLSKSKAYNSTIPAGTAGPSGGVVVPSSSPIAASGAGEVKAGSVLALVLVAGGVIAIL